MTTKDIIEIVKESDLRALLTEKEKHEVIKRANFNYGSSAFFVYEADL